MKVLAISGSIRNASINSAFCRATACIAPAPLAVEVFTGLDGLPPFNPDLEPAAPAPVRQFRAKVAGARALLIASPEYAHGVSGVLKNALDWLVSDENAAYKPVALFNTAPRARHAYDSLREILTTMSMRIVQEASIAVPLTASCTSEEAILGSTDVCCAIERALQALLEHLLSSRTDQASI